MTISSKFLTVLAILGGTVLAGLTSGFTTAKDPDPTYFFEHVPGTEVSNPSNWTLSPDRTGCDGEDKSCKIELAADYVEVTATQTIIDSTILPQLPTTMSQALFEVPDATSGVYEHIYNQDQ
ncbi:hypothetical protein FSB73_22000 [Arachidicoccus ginsenosidivorans]|uniref:Uncharacterized protein n=1 Tax=Arachidicoccus ginsenosidivorans TaxID=496057 RepID=A0A5B8VS53_9BACT|nr:hypothetical protein [Arachidicoccus ginsenosidivorans]QEC73941.1 hypothetical protein FSB73_22000 [Arachidicoccus ginsenosidivorans]